MSLMGMMKNLFCDCKNLEGVAEKSSARVYDMYIEAWLILPDNLPKAYLSPKTAEFGKDN
jgi:hypothetical protein